MPPALPRNWGRLEHMGAELFAPPSSADEECWSDAALAEAVGEMEPAQSADTPGLTVRVAYQHGLYHDPPETRPDLSADPRDLDTAERPPHLVAAFNAGIWGYGESWVASVAHATGARAAQGLLPLLAQFSSSSPFHPNAGFFRSD